ncbi:Putative S-adenosylmethionine decarboxylase proenzyme [Clostridium chauvoei JF4335]|uniref:S-adenosylmethionine decarboxylase proenzyme n=1 Tax=Clostridium chauvoei JF4335 TaxID=1351755 RepID=S6EMW4_9CLOT|nr:adenosylmethionine decarboxylase [Clostridium chauvoei]CDG00615.1 Putative S-adenosylmethionine decarboxylase proenzyme [Clostridium chauvoei JF4335]ATD54127.1 S-adenosylmethionine decarboxylase proenzyme [Clostridium chauvoei]ATD58426.1 S-adenosylmethionine decarboxylase proenzyme [Clostridium chauvoei]QBJ76347.1 S-adenosylmethionine decarboxylase proenzyme [Clostridium chauvoei]SLK22601.1 Putative S-adenosylmethionine decarboxylase proenzyme [Clostridium chauvoei JF4335]
MKIEQLGRHILVEYYNCDKEILKNHEIIEEYMKQAAIEANATIVTSCFHKFNPWGVSGAVIIQESHLTIHTWPEYGYASVDLFTCGDSVNPWIGFKYLEEVLKSERSESTEVARGLVDKVKTFANGAYDNMKINYKMEV